VKSIKKFVSHIQIKAEGKTLQTMTINTTLCSV